MYSLLFALWVCAVAISLAFVSGTGSRNFYREAVAAYRRLRLYPEALSLLDVVDRAIADKRLRAGERAELEIEGERWVVELHDAGSGFDPNSLKVDELKRLLEMCRVETGERMDTMIDSFLDWRDGDDSRRLNGAEKDYYQSLPVPYKPRNGRLLSVEEIALIRGFDPETYRCLSGLLSLYGRGRININDAGNGTLSALGFSEREIEAILKERKEKPFESMEDLREVVPGIDGMEAKEMIGFDDSGIYRVVLYSRGTEIAEFVWDRGRKRVLEYR